MVSPGFRRSMMSSHHQERESRAFSGPSRNRSTVPSGTVTSNAAAHDRPEKPGRRHADDREARAIQRERASDDVGSAAEPCLPPPVADDRHRTVRPAAASIVSWRERTPEHRAHAEGLEVATARVQPVHELRLAAASEIEAFRAPRRGPLGECRTTVAHLFPERIRPRSAIQQHEPGRLPHGQRSQQTAR